MLKLLLITATTTALDHYARTVPAVVDRVRAAQVTADACDTFAPCAAPVLTDAADADAALASLRTHGYAIVESPGLAERWLDGARAMTADDQLRGAWGSKGPRRPAGPARANICALGAAQVGSDCACDLGVPSSGAHVIRLKHGGHAGAGRAGLHAGRQGQGSLPADRGLVAKVHRQHLGQPAAARRGGGR